MPRVAFRLRIKAGKEKEYDDAHKNVWPALLAKLKEVSISKYSIFRLDQDLFLFMHVVDFDAALRGPRSGSHESEMAEGNGQPLRTSPRPETE